MEKRTIFVIKSGYANIPISKGLVSAKFLKPPNDVNKSAGKTAGIKVKNKTIRVAKNTVQVTKEVFDAIPSSTFLTRSFNIIFKVSLLTNCLVKLNKLWAQFIDSSVNSIKNFSNIQHNFKISINPWLLLVFPFDREDTRIMHLQKLKSILQEINQSNHKVLQV